MQIIKKIRFTATAIPLMFTTISCNVFSPLDSPSTDAQYLSKARACFDEADYTCARENYAKVTSVEYNDQARSEEIFAILDESGVNLGSFISGFTGSSSGVSGILTGMAKGFIANNSASATTRNRIFLAYLSSLTITDAPLRGLAKFLSAAALIGEILAEDAGSDGIFDANDIVQNDTTCLASGGIPDSFTSTTGCHLSTSKCSKPAASSIIVGTAIDIDTLTSLQDETPTFRMIVSLIDKVQSALSDIQGTDTASGGLSASLDSADALSNQFTQLSDLGISVDEDGPDRCYRYIIISQLFSTSTSSSN